MLPSPTGARRHVFDVPGALDVAAETVERMGVDDRVTLVGGDYRQDDIGGGYDVVLVFNVLHAHDAGASRELLARTYDAVAPGGRIAVLDQFEGATRLPVARAGIAFVALTYATTLGGTIHPVEAATDWLRAAGFDGVERRPIRRAGVGTSLLQATRPA